MKPERWRQIDQLFDAALALEPGQRAAFLDEACGADEDLRKEVETLLASDRQSHIFIDGPALQAAAEFLPERQASRLSTGESIGPYKILSLLGTGGMGEVYRARDTRLDRDVAIKVLPDHFTENHVALKRFEQEAKALAALSHSNVLAIHDFGTDQGISFVVMEFLEGETLRKALHGSALPWRRALEISIGITEGLAAAHSKGIIHRDLKPENIFLTKDGSVKILDFGLARKNPEITRAELTSAPTESKLTRTGVVQGTVPYMSPEQVRAESVDTRSDIFSFGCVLYEMLTGHRAFSGNSAADTMAAILKEEPPDPAASEQYLHQR
jgi:serine/threonine protein kinase